MRKSFVAATLVIVGLVTLGVSACSHHHSMSPEKAKKYLHHRLNDALDDVKATDAQRREVFERADARVDQAAKLFGPEAKAEREKLMTAWEKGELDAAAARALVDQRLATLREVAYAAVDDAVALQQTFTPEQRAKLIADLRAHEHE